MREKLPSMRGKLCPHLAEGYACDNRVDCDYAHTVEEARIYNQNFKTKLCSFALSGDCKKASNCRYAHSYSELGQEGTDDEMISPQKCNRVGRNVSSVSTAAADLTPVRARAKSSDCLLERPPTSAVRSKCCRAAFFAPADLPSVVVPSSLHYVEQLTIPKYIVPRNVLSKKDRAPFFVYDHQAQLYYHPSLGVYQPTNNVPTNCDYVPYED